MTDFSIRRRSIVLKRIFTKFKLTMEADTSASYYYPLGLSEQEISRYVNLLDRSHDALTAFTDIANEKFDIYKYAVDIYGNSIILVKNIQRYGYSADYNFNVMSSMGTLWFKPKDHPLAFPFNDFYSADFGNLSKNAYLSEYYDKVYDFDMDSTGRCILAAVPAYKDGNNNLSVLSDTYKRYDNVSIIAAEFR